MEIRKLTGADYDRVVELYKELEYIHVQARPDCFIYREKDEIYPEDIFVQNLARPDDLELGAFEDGKLVGVVKATLWEKSETVEGVRTVCLDNIYVLPDYRRRGIATILFTEVENWAKEKGAVRLNLHVWNFNKGAVAMYKAMGMTPQRYVFEKKL